MMCVSVSESVCVCVCECERECVCVCVSVCVFRHAPGMFTFKLSACTLHNHLHVCTFTKCVQSHCWEGNLKLNCCTS